MVFLVMSEVEKLANTLNLAIVIFAIWSVIFVCDALFGPFAKTDSTDSPDRRSGMTLHTDYLTGCQYLSRNGGITPRLNIDGTVMCNSSIK